MGINLTTHIGLEAVDGVPYQTLELAPPAWWPSPSLWPASRPGSHPDFRPAGQGTLYQGNLFVDEHRPSSPQLGHSTFLGKILKNIAAPPTRIEARLTVS
jgi:hypothetical protein